MTRDIAKYTKECPKCLLNKVKSSTRQPMAITPTPQKAFDTIVIDTIGPLAKSNAGNQYAITMICDLTKYLITVPIRDKSAKTVAQAIFDNFILIYGPMKNLQSDMGTEFRNETLSELCTLMKIDQKIATAYHHQSLGSIERNHRVFNEYLRAFLTDMTQWDEYLHYFSFLYNTTKHSSFDEKYSPYELIFAKKANAFEFVGSKVDPIYNIENYAREVKYRLQITHEKAKLLLNKTKINNKIIYDKKVRPIDLKLGEKVLLKKEPYEKHANIYQGPFIIDELTECNAKIRNPANDKTQTVHKNRLVNQK